MNRKNKIFKKVFLMGKGHISFLNVNMVLFLSSSMKVNTICFGCGQNNTFDEVILGLGNYLSDFQYLQTKNRQLTD